MVTILKACKGYGMKFIFIILFGFYCASCQNTDHQRLEETIAVTPVPKFNYSIIGSDEKPALAVAGSLISSVSLKEILLKQQFDFARIECGKLNEFKPYAYLKVKEEKKEQNTFNSVFLMKICPEDDANSEYCVKSLEDFKARIKTDLNCEVVFGGMAKPKMIISNRFAISSHQILNAEKYIPE